MATRMQDQDAAHGSEGLHGAGQVAGDGHEPKKLVPVAPALAFVLAPLLTFVLVTVGASGLRHEAPMAYYQTVAFLVPSLLVTLALQGRFFRITAVAPPPPWVARRRLLARIWVLAQRAAEVALLSYLAVGELAALYVLATQQRSPLSPAGW